MTAQAHDTTTQAPPAGARPARRADAGTVRLSQRDIDGLLLAGEHYGAPLDLLAAALRVEETRLPAITARWRRAGYAATGRLGPGPGWCWLTRDGMAATGRRYPALRPSLGRLAHIRAVLAARLWLAAGPVWSDGQAWWHSERRLRADLPAAGRGVAVARRFLAVVATPDGFGGCDGAAGTGRVAAGGEASAVCAADRAGL
jgi:hypothetical protein